MSKRPYISTGHAARLLGVTPDTVLKWIKRGKLIAMRTAGGHFRIPREQLDCLVEARSSKPPGTDRQVATCWEYFSEGGHLREECNDCLVRKSRALRCYELVQIPKQSGFQACFHYKGECRNCPYYNEVIHSPIKLLVVTDSMDMRQRLAAQAGRSRFKLDFASHGYDCSAQVDRFRPEMVLIDCALPADEVAALCMHLASDSRVPGVRVVLAVPKSGRPVEHAPGVVGSVAHPFALADLDRFIEETPEPEPEQESEQAIH
ncbi:MAG: excisionase family DNA-binding protein [Deltaproteobacteria bacterium]|nr:excisionase family DNA-binding protein [Deltaproteobacteria bacterium]